MIQLGHGEKDMTLAKPRPFHEQNFLERIRSISMFFDGRDEVHKTLKRLVKRLDNAGISYALMGGIAVNAHKYVRTTGDVDILLTMEGFNEFKAKFTPKFYDPVPGRSRRFVDKKNSIQVDFLLTGLYPGSGKPGPISFPHPDDVSQEIKKLPVINLP